MKLHVVIVPDGSSWFAQGIELDYAAAGSSVDEVKYNFERGLKLTAELHVQRLGKVVLAPMSVADMRLYGVYTDGGTYGTTLEQQSGFVWECPLPEVIRLPAP